MPTVPVPAPNLVAGDCDDMATFWTSLTSGGIYPGTQPTITQQCDCGGDGGCTVLGVVTPAPPTGTEAIIHGQFIDIRKNKTP